MFKSGDRVRMKMNIHPLDYEYVHGEVTIAKENESKVLFDEDWAPDYWYYPNKDLELIEEKK